MIVTPNGRRLRNLLRVWLILVIITLLLCIGIGVFLLYSWNTSAEQKIKDSLAALDQHFSLPQSLLLSGVTDTALLPLHVGSFQRGDISDCGDKSTRNEQCYSAVYNDVNRINGFIYMTIKLVPTKTPDVLQSLTAQHIHCGPNIAENKLQSTASHRYVYTICYSSLIISTGSLSGVTWVNSGWLISMEDVLGEEPANMIQFANQYPF